MEAENVLPISKWAHRFWEDPGLGGNVCSILTTIDGTLLDMTFDQVIPFLTSKRRPHCVALTEFRIPDNDPSFGISLDQFRQIVTLLGPDLRTLSFTILLCEKTVQLQQYIDILDWAIPDLRQLTISFSPRVLTPRFVDRPPQTAPLRGLKKLRYLFFHTQSMSSVCPDSHKARIDYFSRLGSDDCVYNDIALGTDKKKKEFNKAVIDLKVARRKS